MLLGLALANRSAALVKLGRVEEALEDLEPILSKIIPYDKNFIKLYERKAVCHLTINKFERAQNALDEAKKVQKMHFYSFLTVFHRLVVTKNWKI